MRRFPLLRRLTAVVAHLLLLQLAFAGAAGACPLGEHGAQHDGMRMSGAPAPGGEHERASAPMASAHLLTSPASDHAGSSHCDMSCPATSCAAAGHCLTNATLVSGDTHHAFELEHGSASMRAGAEPHSVSRAPEPPPPRA